MSFKFVRSTETFYFFLNSETFCIGRRKTGTAEGKQVMIMNNVGDGRKERSVCCGNRIGGFTKLISDWATSGPMMPAAVCVFSPNTAHLRIQNKNWSMCKACGNKEILWPLQYRLVSVLVFVRSNTPTQESLKRRQIQAFCFCLE